MVDWGVLDRGVDDGVLDPPAPLTVDVYRSDAPMSSTSSSLSAAAVRRAGRQLDRGDGELEVMVAVTRADGLLLVSATTAGCVATSRPRDDAPFQYLVGDRDADVADEVELVLGGVRDSWPWRYLTTVEAARAVLERFAGAGPPLPGLWEDQDDPGAVGNA